MENLKQFRKKVNFRAYMSDCKIDICKTPTTSFGYQRNFSSKINFKLYLARNVFDCILQDQE